MGFLSFFRRSDRKGTTLVTRPATEGAFYGNEALMEGDFVLAKGRSHVANAPYLLPKDLQEGNRLDFQHFMLRYALHGNYAAPLKHPRDILDIGAGTGRWAIEMAELYPDANVLGVDIVTPTVDADEFAGSMRPSNYVFVPGNVLEGLPFLDKNFDFIHARLLVFGIPTLRWPDVFREVKRLLRPNGWFESVEADCFPENGGPDMDILGRWTVEISKRRDIDVLAVRNHGQTLRDAGFVNVRTQDIILPGGTTGGRLGNLVATDYFAVQSGLRGAIAGQGIASTEEFDQVLARARVTINEYPCRFHFPLAIGQRPN